MLIPFVDILILFVYTLVLTLHIISVSETWLNARVSNDLVALDGYFLVRHDRVGCIGGGVVCYVHNSLRIRLIAASINVEVNDSEYLLIEICLPNDEVDLFASVYRRHKGSLLNDFVESLAFLIYIKILYNIIGGDLNCNLLTNSFEANYLRDLMLGLSLNIVNSDPTFHTATSNSGLDILVVDDNDKVLTFAKSSSPFIAGHDLLELSYSLTCRLDREQSILGRSYRKIDASVFLEYLRSITINVHHEMNDLSGETDVEVLCARLSGTLLDALNVSAPALNIGS